MLRYNIQTGVNGSVLIPTTPFAVGEEVEVVLRTPKDRSLDDNWRPDPVAVRTLIESRTFTVEMTDEEVEKLKYERRMRRTQ
jgi:hypothetical protein